MANIREKILLVKTSSITAYEKNAKAHPETQIDQIARSISEFGFSQPLVVDKDNIIIVGHGRFLAAKKLGLELVPCITAEDLTAQQVKAYRLADNKLNESGWDMELVVKELKLLQGDEYDISVTGFTLADIEREDFNSAGLKQSLKESFIIPPFSVWDTKQEYWQERKREWRRLIGDSREGRSDELLGGGMKRLSSILAPQLSGTSEFDPVVAEIAYRWFCPLDGKIIDPFSGGVVRGAVASVIGLDYTGVDLGRGQVQTNRAQYKMISEGKATPELNDKEITDMTALTPVESRGGYFFKREDYFSFGGARGAKVRGCLHILNGVDKPEEVTTAGSRKSPQVEIVARIAKEMGIKFTAHIPEGENTTAIENALADGAHLKRHKAGYNSVIVARAREYAKETGALEIPFGMETPKTIEANKFQVQNIPEEAKRIVIPVGSGMTLATILTGMKEKGITTPVIGVSVGKDPEKLLDKYAPEGWRKMVTIVKSSLDYEQSAYNEIAGVILDPIYEAKCIEFMEKGDLLWVVGRRMGVTVEKGKIPANAELGNAKWIHGDSKDIATIAKGEYDMIFSCPPYYDLEMYEDGEGDLSMLGTYEEFIEGYEKIIAETVSMLKDNRFACFVVGDIRDKNGYYRGFVLDTIRAFEKAGMKYYNDIVLLNAISTAPVRSRRPFSQNRKVTKVHQNVLAFYKGDPAKITKSFQELPKVERLHHNVVVFYKGDIEEIKTNYEIVNTGLDGIEFDS